MGSPVAHPAIHRGSSVRVPGPLFERAGTAGVEQRDGSRQLHPAGNPRTVDLEQASVTVRNGDCLWTIAAEILDSDDPQRVEGYWRAIFRLNRAVIGTNPNRLLPGQVLRLPGKPLK